MIWRIWHPKSTFKDNLTKCRQGEMKKFGYGTVIADFTTHGESHFYGLPYPSVDSLDPMDHFCSFDVSKIIPKNMQNLLYVTFKPFLT